jgi:hypothetical protein
MQLVPITTNSVVGHVSVFVRLQGEPHLSIYNVCTPVVRGKVFKCICNENKFKSVKSMNVLTFVGELLLAV